jgi:CRISPR-associated endonuclease/helicase Cas3
MSFDDFFFGATEKHPFAYQVELAESLLCDRIIRVPTGGGKTAASILAWMWKTERDPQNTPKRLVIFLPMRSLVQQTWQRVTEWLRTLGLSEKIALFELLGEHRDLKAQLREWTKAPNRPTILIGTVDLLLSAALNRGYATSRFGWPAAFGLLHNSALWIVDEIQLMGAATATFSQLHRFRMVFGTWRPVYVWWMSATVEPSWLETVDYTTPPEITPQDTTILIRDLGERYTASKPLRTLKVLDSMSVLELHQEESLTIAVVNTVSKAQQLYRDLNSPSTSARKKGKSASSKDGAEILLLHSRFRPMDREAHSQRLLRADAALRDEQLGEGEKGLIVVATQVLEAGLDISARTLITELAPWDSMVQRFGRLNRDGKNRGAVAAWVDLKSDVAPYTSEQLDDARKRIRDMTDVSPAALAPIPLPPPPKHEFVIRQHDLHGLFSTEKDLAGGFTDISGFIRDSEEVDVYLFWRDFDRSPNADGGQLPPECSELCAVPVHQAQEFATESALWEWNDGTERWESRRRDDLVPGMVLLCSQADGGYSKELGWTGLRGDRPAKCGAGIDKDSDKADPKSESGWCDLSKHLTETEETARAIGTELSLEPKVVEALALAGRWHDIGKSLPAWQRAAKRAVEKSGKSFQPGVWAKFPAARNTFRPGVRHEEASALHVAGLWARGEPGWSELAVYLVACHHGKVRTSLGVHGAKQISDLPALERTVQLAGWAEESVQLDMSWLGFAPLGRYDRNTNKVTLETSSWTELVARLLGPDCPVDGEMADCLGPFRLALLEAIIVAADVRASRETEMKDANG